MKKRRCLCCKEYYPMDEMINPRNGWYKDFDHMAAHGLAKSRKQKAVKDKQEHTKKKRELKDNDKSFQTKKTQQIFNKYIRLRDSSNPCISCQRHHSGQYHAGHYKTVGANPELRFDERNCHKQCSACNNHLSGNIVNYRINLIALYGVGLVESLEQNMAPKRYTIANLKTIQKWFNRKIKRMELSK